MNTYKIINALDKIIEYLFYVLIITITFSIALVECSIGGIIICWITKKIIKKDSSLPMHLFLVIFAIFILWNLASFFNSQYLKESIRGLMKVIKYGLLLLVTIDTVKSKQILKNITYILIIWSVVIALNGIIQNMLGFDIIRLMTIDPQDMFSRISSSFIHSNDYGAYLVVIISVFLSFIFSKKINLRNRIYFLIALMPLFFCFIRTYSRGAWISLFIAMCILSLLKHKKIFVVLIMLIVASSFFLPQQIRTRAVDLVNFKQGTSWQRIKLWSGALKMINQRPLLGFGVNTYTRNFPAYKPADYPDATYPHNCYLQMAAEIGLIGLGLFFIFAFLAFMYIGKSLRFLPPGWPSSIAKGLFAGLIGFLIHSSVDTHLYSVNLAVMFYFLLGFCVALCNYAKKNPA